MNRTDQIDEIANSIALTRADTTLIVMDHVAIVGKETILFRG